MARIISSEEFKNEVLVKGAGKYLVDFFAIWCGPCRMVGPVLDEISAEYPNEVTSVKVDTDKSPDIAAMFRVSAVPTMILFEDGEAKKSIVGAQPKANILNFLGIE